MARYIPRVQQVLAEQFDGTRPSAQAIGALPGVVLRAVGGDLYVSIGGRWTYVNVGSWVVRSRAGLEVLADENFQLLYEVAP